MLKTVTTVLEVSPADKQKIMDSLKGMSDAQNYVVDQCYEYEESNSFRMHKFVYKPLREKFKLPAQLAVVANKYACSAVKGAVRRKGKKPVFSGKAIHYDMRSSTVDLPKQSASILTISGRIKAHLRIPRYFQRFVYWNLRESNLVLCRDGVLRLMICIEKPSTPSAKTGKVIGVDRGIDALIATSTGCLVEGKEVFEIKKRYVALRSRLQGKGTRSARRHLKKLSGREKRFMRDVNHCLSKKLIGEAGKDGVIVLESLKGIRNAKHRKKQNWLFSNWAFYQLEQFLVYKGEETGVVVEFVPAKDTSKICSLCGSLRTGQRQGSVFRCKACGVVLHADLNAAKNILYKYTLLMGCSSTSPLLPTGLSKPSISMDSS